MRGMTVLAALSGSLLFVHGVAYAKNITQYGNEPDFWKDHVLVVGTVDHVEHRFGREFHVSFIVSESVPTRYAIGNRASAKYEAPGENLENANFGNLLGGLKRGERVLVLLRPSHGFATLPNGVGERFAMMPVGAPLYRISDAADPIVSDTVRMVKACTVENLQQKITALSAVLEETRSRHIKEFGAQYIAHLVRQTEADLANANTLLKDAKSKLEIGPLPNQKR